ncbi:atherin-like [Tachyglossus aculeatus]|uniref:atherin-like n=1 Tax=Tachyglossus aculeatus TaxID=9261 RepID=UPI0018F710B3|nr:atherin-like [Tachyglossus aculeatus]
MAVANLRYSTGISSGFKVYILEGPPSLKADPRLRLLPRPRIPIYPIKRQLSPEPRRAGQSPQAPRRAGQSPQAPRRAGQSPQAPRRAGQSPQEPPPAKVRRAEPRLPACLQASSERPGWEAERGAMKADPPTVSPRPLPEKPAGPLGALPPSVLQQMRPSVITRLPSLPRPSPAPARHREFPVLLESPLAWGLDREVPLLCLEPR